jgi:pimeloyl-ACP methyl ester carboxylesterase
MNSEPKGIYVLVHGGNMSAETWNRFAKREVYPPGGKLGGRIWDSIIPALEAESYRVFAPTLEDEHSSHLTDHIDQISSLIIDNDLRGIILVGHSYGGMVITGVAAKMAERICRLVYVDAALPDPGQSLFDLFASGSRDPMSFEGLEPAAPYVEKLQFDPRKLQSLPKTYILCTESEFAPITHVAREKIATAREKWTYIEIPSSHVPMASMPERFLKLLLEAARRRDDLEGQDRQGERPQSA